MAEGAERFRGLWEDEMFARQICGKVFSEPEDFSDRPFLPVIARRPRHRRRR